MAMMTMTMAIPQVRILFLEWIAGLLRMQRRREMMTRNAITASILFYFILYKIFNSDFENLQVHQEFHLH